MKRLNVKLVAWLIGGVSVLCVSVHFLHAFQIDRNASSLLAQARKEKEDGDMEGSMKRYTQYLKHKDDPQGYEELAVVVTDIAESPRAKRTDVLRAFTVLEEAVRRHPDLSTVRRRMVDYTMRFARYRDAKEHLEILRQENRTDPTLDVKYAQCQIITGFEEKAEKLLYELLGFDETKQEFLPDARGRNEVDAYVLLADLLRKKFENPQRANKVMAQMVAMNKESSRAYLERARYMQRNGLDKSTKRIQSDLARALELAPEDPMIVLAMAEVATTQKDFAKAQRLLEEGVKSAPNNEGMYRALASLALAQGKPDDAMKHVEEGLKAIPGSQALVLVRADLQLQKNDLAGVRASIKIMREANFMHELVDYLDARIMLSEKRWAEASDSLERLRPLMARWPELINQIDLFLGRCYETLGQPDRQMEAYKRALDNDPASMDALLGYARGLQASGKPVEAAELFARANDQLGEKKLSSPAILSNLLTIEMSTQAQKPVEERDWTQVDEYVQQISEDKAFSELQKTVLQAEVLMTKGEKEHIAKAKALLSAAQKEHPKELSVWLVTINLVQRDIPEADKALEAEVRAQKQADRVLRVIELAEKQLGDVPALRQHRANLLARQGAKDPKKAKEGLAKLEQGMDKFTDDQRSGLWSDLGAAYYRLRDYENTRRCWSKVAAARKDDPKIRQTMFDLAQEFGDEVGMKEATDEVKKQMGSQSGLYNYCMASQLIWEIRNKRKEVSELPAARKYLKDGAAVRSEWHELARLEGEADELEGKVDSAIANYQRALQLGPPNPSAARRLVIMLYGKNRIPEAEEALKLLGSRGGDGMEKFRDLIKLHKGDTEGAAESAEESVKADPDNVEKLLWLAQMYDRAKRPDDAEKAYRDAWAKGKQVPQTWLMLVQHLANNEKRADAEEIVAQVKDGLPADQAEQVLAQCYEMLGNKQVAEQHFVDMLKADPNDLTVLRNVAMYYVRSNQMDKAGEHVATMLKQAKKADDKDREHILWARRVMAKILAGKGDYPNLQKAVKMLEANSVDGKLLPEDMVLGADLLSVRPELASRNAAIDMLEQLQAVRPLKLEEQFLLVRLYERTGRWNEARDRMSQLLVQAEKTPTYLAQFGQMLLKHDDLDNAVRWIEKLEAIAPKALDTAQLRAGLLVKQGKPDQAVQLLEGMVPRPLEPKQLPKLAAVANALEELNQNVAAEKLLRDFASQQPRAILVLASFLSRHGNIEESFELCEKARKSQQLGAVVEVGLQTLRLRSREVSKKHFTQVEGWINKAMLEDPESIFLQSKLADLRDLQGRYDEVVKIYRSILARDDASEQRKAIAMNNLAFVLALADRPLGDPAEALKLTEKSLSILGPSGDLLDTRGMAHLALGNIKQARNDVEAAIADAPAATKYLHLAMVQMAAKDKDAAIQAMEDAQAYKLDPSQISKMERKHYDQLIKLAKTK